MSCKVHKGHPELFREAVGYLDLRAEAQLQERLAEAAPGLLPEPERGFKPLGRYVAELLQDVAETKALVHRAGEKEALAPFSALSPAH